MSFTKDQLVIFAARTGNLPLLKERVEAGGDINGFDPTYGSALGEAIRQSNLEVVDWLLKNGVDLEVQQHDGVGPLEIALNHPKPELVYKLVCAGAKLRKRSRPHYRQRLEECLAAVANSSETTTERGTSES